MKLQKTAAAFLACVLLFSGCAKAVGQQSSAGPDAGQEPGPAAKPSQSAAPAQQGREEEFQNARRVYTGKTVQVLDAPGGAEPLFSVPGMMPVIRLEEEDGWSRCLFGEKEGWIPSDAISTRFEGEPCALPKFLSPEQKLLFLKAQGLYDGYCPGVANVRGYLGFTDTEETITGPNGWSYALEQLYPTLREWTEALDQVFTPSFAESCFLNTDDEVPAWTEQDGRLYFVGGDRGSSCPGELSFELLEKTEERIRFSALAFWENDQPYRVEYPIEMVKTADGWRFENFITRSADLVWDDLRLAAKETLPKPGQPLSFLSEEQRQLYENAQQWVYPLWGITDSLMGEKGGCTFRFKGGERVEINGESYILYENSYEEFQKAFCTVFTKECWQQLEQAGRYRNWEGTLAADQKPGVPLQKGCTRAVMEEHPDEFRLESSTENEVMFTLITHYDQTPEQDKMTVSSREYPIRMQKTQEGWRIAELHSGEFG